MRKVRISKYKKIVIIISLTIFILLMGIVMLKPDWITDFLDSAEMIKPIVRLIKGENYEEDPVDTGIGGTDEKEEGENVADDELPADRELTNLLVESKTGKVEFSVDMGAIKEFTAGELYMEYEGVNINSVECIEPYDCVVNKAEDGEIILISIASIGNIEKTGPVVKFGSVEYSGSGSLTVKESSKYVVLEDEDAVYFKPQIIELD